MPPTEQLLSHKLPGKPPHKEECVCRSGVDCLNGCASNDTLTEQSVRRWLPDEGAKWNVQVFQTVSSTNTVLKNMAEQGAPEGTILIASEQTAGRGRMGRSFYSPSGTGVYMSFLLRPSFLPTQSLYITTAAAVAVAEAIEFVTKRPTQIKWVNDVYLDGHKTCGILTEAAFDTEKNRLSYAVLGIGINMRTPPGGYPEELRPIITSVFSESSYNTESRDRIVAEVISRFWRFYESIPEKPFLYEYRKRSLLEGKSVDVISGNKRRPAMALDIDDEFRLHIRYSEGAEEYLQSGEVSVKPRKDAL